MSFKLFVLAALVAVASAEVVFVVFAALVAVAQAGYLGYSAPVAVAHAPLTYAAPVAKAVAVDTDYDPNPHYSYSYDVQDAITGDSKGASETRDGDVVKGSYNFLEADGTRRVVEYTADPVNGYNAVVRNEAAAKVAVAKVAAPVAYHAPLAYHAPVAYHHAPLAYASAPVYRKVIV